MGSDGGDDLRLKRGAGARYFPVGVMIWFAFFGLESASAGGNMSEAEYTLLPEFCRAQGNVSSSHYSKYASNSLERKWRSALGSNYSHYHHYCWSIVSIARAYKASPLTGSKSSLARNAIDDIGYVLERATPDFLLLPEVYTKLGEAYLLVSDDRNAEVAFRKAWEVKPGYWRPYVWWGQRLLQQGKSRDALAVAEQGLQHAPDAKALQDLVRDIRLSRGVQKQ